MAKVKARVPAAPKKGIIKKSKERSSEVIHNDVIKKCEQDFQRRLNSSPASEERKLVVAP